MHDGLKERTSVLISPDRGKSLSRRIECPYSSLSDAWYVPKANPRGPVAKGD